MPTSRPATFSTSISGPEAAKSSVFHFKWIAVVIMTTYYQYGQYAARH